MTGRTQVGNRFGYVMLALAMGSLAIASRAGVAEDQGLREGLFKAQISADEYFIVRIAKDGQGELRVQRVKYKLPGALAGTTYARQPIGRLQEGALSFEFPLVRTYLPAQPPQFRPRPAYVYYSARLTPAGGGTLHCELSRIDAMSAAYQRAEFSADTVLDFMVSDEDRTKKNLSLTLRSQGLPAALAALPPGASLVFTIPPQYKILSAIEVLPDHETFAFAGLTDSGGAANYCGTEVATGLEEEGIYMGIESRAIQLAARKGGKALRIVNGKVYPGSDSLAISPNGQHSAYISQESDGFHLWVDGKSIYKDRYIGESHFPNKALRISDGGVAFTMAGYGGAWRMLNGQTPGPLYANVGEPAITPDGTHLAYLAVKKTGTGVSLVLVLDGKEIDAGAGDMVDTVTLSADGRHVCYFVNRGGHHLCVDGDNLVPFDSIWFDPRFIEGTDTVFYGVEKDRKRWIVLGSRKEECERFDAYTNPVASADGSTVAWAGLNTSPEPASYIFVNGQKQKAAGLVKNLLLDKSGRLVAYATEVRAQHPNGSSRQQAVFCNGKLGKLYDSVSNLMLGPDQTVVYTAGKGDFSYVVVGTNESDPYDKVWAPVVKDGKLVYVALIGRAIVKTGFHKTPSPAAHVSPGPSGAAQKSAAKK